MGVEAAQGHDSAAQVARFFDLRRVEVHRISDQLVFLRRGESLMVVVGEGAPVAPSAWYQHAQACQHRQAVEAHQILVSAVTIHAEKSGSRSLAQTFSAREVVVARLDVLPEVEEGP